MTVTVAFFFTGLVLDLRGKLRRSVNLDFEKCPTLSKGGQMGSQAQDERHEQILQRRRNEAADLERQVKAKENELEEMRKKLEDAERALANQEHIDIARD